MHRDSKEHRLFHHYVTRVAVLMIHIDSERNPWKSTYPCIALGNASSLSRSASRASKSLYYALLAQSASNLANLYSHGHQGSSGSGSGSVAVEREMQNHALKYYGLALRELRASLETPSEDYSACIGTMYILAVTDGAYSNVGRSWRRHFDGAASLIGHLSKQKPWGQSDDAWVISQSLALSFEVAQTGCKAPTRPSPLTDVLLGAVSSRKDFAYTIGAHRSVINSISAIRMLEGELAQGQVSADLDPRISRIWECLMSEEAAGDADSDDKRVHWPPEEDRLVGEEGGGGGEEKTKSKTGRTRLNQLHLNIFRNATLVYFYRAFFDAPPFVTQRFVSRVLADATEFLDLNGGNISMWPVFIAAVEVCSDHDQRAVDRWLEFSYHLGLHNRLLARTIIHAVWRERDAEARRRAMHPSEVSVGWRDVQARLGLDICLL
ncbi:hypothetical protein A1O3_06570 [Capronia epimyces CBS 606.96]|uniref:Uncharacterized protein n=1 Tax=Capronia epimyces CBS 606.96 TaxID=1182542 RepID=W9XZD8_9EURO|nr:uncharacterized protein A1O3_06570 [Capronia epimyces CBS 606.96]EXJ82755.1 hypothetical protein A1O3_06570 [Capronia epimyces CBS 606.96]